MFAATAGALCRREANAASHLRRKDTMGDPLGPITKVEDVMGVPTFTVDGEPHMVPIFETSRADSRHLKQFEEVGTGVYSFYANAARDDLGVSQPTWPEPDRWDYSELDERAQRVLEADPDALIFPRLYLGAPDWWLERYPDELEVLDDGSRILEANVTMRPSNRPMPSIASEVWRRDMGIGLRRVIEHIQGSEYASRMFGYFLTGLRTEEWYPWAYSTGQLSGYGQPTILAFQKWLRAKYRDVAALRSAWNNSDVEFESVTTPSPEERRDQSTTFRDPRSRMSVIDFYQFYNELIAETIDCFAAIAREATGGRKVLGAFYAYMYNHGGNPEGGHTALRLYNASPNLDFVYVTSCYSNRELGSGGETLRAPITSVQAHGKLWFHDNDIASYVYARRQRERLRKRGNADQRRIEQMDSWMSEVGTTDTPEDTIAMYRRSAGFALCNGAYQSYFDLVGGSYDAPDLMEEVGRLNAMFERSTQHDRSSCSQVLFVSDEASCSYASFMVWNSGWLGRTLAHPQFRLTRMGAPSDHVLVDDLKLVDMSRYRLVVFLNTFALSDEQRALVDQTVKRDDRIVVWCYAPGMFSRHTVPTDGMSSLTGMQVVASEDEAFIAPQIELESSAGGFAAALRDAGLRTIGPEDQLCKLISVRDPEAIALGRLPGADAVTLAQKDMGDWTSIYAIMPDLPPAFYRELARYAGVHVWSERDDSFFANKSYICLHANGPGERTIAFPRQCDVRDAITEELLGEGALTYSQDFRHGETTVLRWA
jgi:hypothetical protein